MPPKAGHASLARDVFRCPHCEDTWHHEKQGCDFQGSKEELEEHLQVCPYEAAEVQSLATPLCGYLRRHPGHAAEALALVREAVERVLSSALDWRGVEIHDKRPRYVEVGALFTEPMLARLVAAAGADVAESPDVLWREFRSECLCSFESVHIPYLHREGAHIVEEMILTRLRGADEIAKMVVRPDREPSSIWNYSYRVWDAALRLAEDALGEEVANATALSAILSVTGHGGRPNKAIGDKIVDAFKEWDLDGNGSISKDEFARVLQIVNVKLPSNVMEEAIMKADANRDGAIDYAEFVS